MDGEYTLLNERRTKKSNSHIVQSVVTFGSVLAIIITSASEKLMFKVVVDSLSSYRTLIVLVLIAMQIPVNLGMIALNHKMQMPIRPETYQFPKWKFVPMALLDLISTNFIFLGGGGVAPIAYVLLLETAIPFHIILHTLFSRMKYHILHWSGAGVIVLGVVLIIVQRLVVDTPHHAKFDPHVIEQNSLMLGDSILFISGIGLQALSSLYKEHSLKKVPMDVYYMNSFVFAIQFGIGLIVSPFNFMIEMLTAGTFDVDGKNTFSDSVDEGWSCIIQGKHLVLNRTDIFNKTLSNGTVVPEEKFFNYTSVLPVFNNDVCNGAGYILLAYVLVTVLSSLVLIWVVTRYGTPMLHLSSSIAIPATVLTLGIYQLYTSYWHVAASEYSLTDLGATFFVTVGAMCYHIRKEPNVFSLTAPAFDNAIGSNSASGGDPV